MAPRGRSAVGPEGGKGEEKKEEKGGKQSKELRRKNPTSSSALEIRGVTQQGTLLFRRPLDSRIDRPPPGRKKGMEQVSEGEGGEEKDGRFKGRVLKEEYS